MASVQLLSVREEEGREREKDEEKRRKDNGSAASSSKVEAVVKEGKTHTAMMIVLLMHTIFLDGCDEWH